MDNCIVDSSVWIDFFNKNSSSQVEKLMKIFPTSISEGIIIILPIIVQEVLQGIEDDIFYSLVKENLFGFKQYEFDNYKFALQAADLYRSLRKKGITIRKANDCLIASVCIQNNFILLHNDKDFDNIAKYTSLKIYK
jgi:predicted nucleic acid-binding protein